MIYPIMVTSALLCVWGAAAYMSVCGLVAVFGGHAVVTVALACGMELGKLVLIFHLHAAWRRLSTIGRLFYVLVLAALVAMTAIESIGYLIESHSRDTAGIVVDRTRLEGLQAEESALRHRIGVIDHTLAQLPEGYVSRRIAERESTGYSHLQADLAANLSQQSGLAASVAAAEAGASPILTIARLAGAPADRVLVVFVILLVAIIEPLSIGLAVAASMAWSGRIGRRQNSAAPAAAEIGRGQTSVAKTAAETAETETAESLQMPELKETAEIGRDGQNQPQVAADTHATPFEEMDSLIIRHRLTAEKVAEITGRAKLKTVEQWLDGSVEIPIKALRELRRWSAAQPAIRLVGR